MEVSIAYLVKMKNLKIAKTLFQKRPPSFASKIDFNMTSKLFLVMVSKNVAMALMKIVKRTS